MIPDHGLLCALRSSSQAGGVLPSISFSRSPYSSASIRVMSARVVVTSEVSLSVEDCSSVSFRRLIIARISGASIWGTTLWFRLGYASGLNHPFRRPATPFASGYHLHTFQGKDGSVQIGELLAHLSQNFREVHKGIICLCSLREHSDFYGVFSSLLTCPRSCFWRSILIPFRNVMVNVRSIVGHPAVNNHHFKSLAESQTLPRSRA